MTVTDIILNGQRVGVGGGGGASLTAGDGLSIVDGVASVDVPVQGILTEEEYNTLPEDKQKKGLYIISDGGDSGGSSGVPKGFIGMWSGENVPNGWALCDGTNGTPNLSNRFVLSSGNGYPVGAQGGVEEVTLMIDQIPSHYHNIPVSAGASSTNATAGGREVVELSGSVIKTRTQGSDRPHTNMPPYYVLAFIMKL